MLMCTGGEIRELVKAVSRLAAAMESQRDIREKGLGGAESTRYTRPPNAADLVDEKTMAGILNISGRTLGRHRRAGRLPGCWIRNGGRILWRVAETQEAWERGIA